MTKTAKLAEYVVFIPLCYNDGRKIEEEKIAKILDKIAMRFGAFTRTTGNEGLWIYKSKKYSDSIDKIEIITHDSEDNDRWFNELKSELKKKLRQKEIFIKKTSEVTIL